MTAGSPFSMARAGRPLCLAILAGGVAMLIAADAPTGGERGVRAYVLSNVFLTNGGSADVCKQMDEGGLDRFYNTLSPELKAKYAGMEKRQALEAYMDQKMGFRRVFLRGERAASVKFPPDFVPGKTPTAEQAVAIGELNGFPKGTGRLAFSNREVVYSACSNPQDFPMLAKNFRTYDGPVATGMNLDGKSARRISPARTGPRAWITSCGAPSVACGLSAKGASRTSPAKR